MCLCLCHVWTKLYLVYLLFVPFIHCACITCLYGCTMYTNIFAGHNLQQWPHIHYYSKEDRRRSERETERVFSLEVDIQSAVSLSLDAREGGCVVCRDAASRQTFTTSFCLYHYNVLQLIFSNVTTSLPVYNKF